jgi:hypothetical protein
VHKESISICVRNSVGKVVMESVIETKASTILQFIDGLRGDLRVTFEEGTWAAWLYDLLKPRVSGVAVCNSRKNALLKAKTPNGVADVPLTPFAVEAFRDQMAVLDYPLLFPGDLNSTRHQTTLRTVWHLTLRRAKVPYFRIYDLRSAYATRLSAGGVADEWVTQLLRQGDLQVFKKYSRMKLQMKREASEKLNRQANEMPLELGTATVQ